MTAPIRIDRWACKQSGSAYLAPELGGVCIRGDVFGHPRFEDGDRVTTGPIVKVNGRVVETQSGSRYLLGDPDPRYLSWLAEHGIAFDPDAPIRMKHGGGR